LSGRGLCDELITRPEESYRLCCVVVCDLETSRIGAPYIYNVRLLRVNYILGSSATIILGHHNVGTPIFWLHTSGKLPPSSIFDDYSILRNEFMVRSPHIFKKSRNHLRTLGARRMT